MRHIILRGPAEWRLVSSSLKHILKIEDVKFFECPVSAIRPRTWETLRQVNETTVGENTEVHASIPILEQLPRYLEAVRIVRQARAERRALEMEKHSRT